MKKILETDRIYLREMTVEDYDQLCEILQDEEVMYAYEHAFSDEEVQNWLTNQLKRYNQYRFGLWAIIDKRTGSFIGQAGLTMQPVEDTDKLEIGYLLKKKYWHQGFATEAAIACRDYAFHQLHYDYVTSIIRDNNEASKAVAKRVGMKKVKQIVKHYYNMDMLHDVYMMTKDDQ
ncbi:GNAT family N-acetyltransferase [Bacillus massiliigorillae]|uniref:GNAT family N-acetyltransferase n=1 Tax=Bacillus massiliigorillae TaxID=1243664 RepID=UPI0003A757F9|nr:GNAT family N-acetyltransferase [Bacillus massiliigorillae]